MTLEKVKKVYNIKVLEGAIKLDPIVPGYTPDTEMLTNLAKLRQHKQNAMYVLKKREPPAKVVAVDIETTSKHFLDGNIRLISVYSEAESFVTKDVSEISEMLADEKILKIFHNAAFDVSWFVSKGHRVQNYTDTMIMSQIIHNTTKSSNSLQAIALEYLGVFLEKGLQDETNWQGEVTKEHEDYCLKDAEITLNLYNRLNQIIQEKRLEVVLDREIRALKAVIELNTSGLPFDYEGWQSVIDDMVSKKNQIGQEIIDFFNSPNLNLASPVQVKNAFADIGINLPSTREEDLLKFVGDYPVIGKLCKFKRLAKKINTYGEKLQAKIHSDGRIYGSWRLIGTDTSRMTCSQPNLQGLPSQAKEYVVAPKGQKFIVADYSTIELRILAEITQDKELISAFKGDEDLHEKTARAIFNYEGTHEVAPEERKVGKVVNFGLIYGLTVFGLKKKISNALGEEISLEQAEIFRNRYFELYPSVLKFQSRMLKAEKIFSLGGRYWSNETSPLKKGSITRYNYPIQATGAEGLKEALANLVPEMPSNWKLVAAIHDEIVLQVPESDAVKAKELLLKTMIEGMQVLLPNVPIDVEINVSSNWSK